MKLVSNIIKISQSVKSISDPFMVKMEMYKELKVKTERNLSGVTEVIYRYSAVLTTCQWLHANARECHHECQGIEKKVRSPKSEGFILLEP